MALAVRQAMEMAKALGAPAISCPPDDPVSWASAGQLRDPESQGWRGPGHCVDEETETQKKEGPHPVSSRGPMAVLAFGPMLLACSPRPVQSQPYPG